MKLQGHFKWLTCRMIIDRHKLDFLQMNLKDLILISWHAFCY